MTGRSGTSDVPTFLGYESWLFQRPCLGSSGNTFVAVSLPVSGKWDGDQPGRCLIALGEICGGGEPMRRKVAMDSRLVGLVQTETDPSMLLKELNSDLIDFGECFFATLIVTVIDGERHQLSLGNAGSLPVLLRRTNGRVEELGGDIASFPLNIVPGQTYESITVPVGSGDVLVILSDGLTTVHGEELRVLNQDQLRRTISQTKGTAASVGQSILEHIRRYEGDRAQRDDITVFCLGRIA